jgi:hypothetical protein
VILHLVAIVNAETAKSAQHTSIMAMCRGAAIRPTLRQGHETQDGLVHVARINQTLTNSDNVPVDLWLMSNGAGDQSAILVLQQATRLPEWCRDLSQ